MKRTPSSSTAQAYLDKVSPVGNALTPEESFRFRVLFAAEHPGLFGHQATASPRVSAPVSLVSRPHRAP